MRNTISAAVTFFLPAGFGNAQDLSSTMSKVGRQYAKAYVTPAADAFGDDINSGLFHTAKVDGILPFGLNLYIGVNAAASILPNSEQPFSLSYLDTVAFPETFEGRNVTIKVPATFPVQNAPTIFGETTAGQAAISVRKDATVTQGGLSQTVHLDSTATMPTIPGLLKTTIAPIPVPQIGLGSILGIDIFIRYLPKLKYSKYGSFELFGYGIKHSISRYITLCPIDIAVQLGWQNLSSHDSTGVMS